MKKVIAYFIMLALVTGVLTAILGNTTEYKGKTDVVSSIVELIGPEVAYADTVGDPKPPPPPPTND